MQELETKFFNLEWSGQWYSGRAHPALGYGFESRLVLSFFLPIFSDVLCVDATLLIVLKIDA